MPGPYSAIDGTAEGGLGLGLAFRLFLPDRQARARQRHAVFTVCSPAVSKLALIVLLCPLTLMLLASSQIEVSAEVAIQARSQALGHKAKAVSPFADERRLVPRHHEETGAKFTLNLSHERKANKRHDLLSKPHQGCQKTAESGRKHCLREAGARGSIF